MHTNNTIKYEYLRGTKKGIALSIATFPTWSRPADLYVHLVAVHTLQFALAIHDNDDDDRNRDKNRDANDQSNVHHHLRIEPFVCKTRIKHIIR